MVVYRYEDLDVWKAARSFCSEVYSLHRNTSVGRDYALWNQLNSAAISVVANIAEGFVRHHDKEFAYFVHVAAGSNAEARALLYLAIDRGHLNTSASESLIQATNSIGRMLRALEASLRTKDEGLRTKD